jgi:hypothetical protein
MKVKFKTSIASSTWSYRPGEVADIDDELAKKFVKSGIAEEVEEKKKGRKKE